MRGLFVSVWHLWARINILDIGDKVQSFWLGSHQCKMGNGGNIMILINTWIEEFNFQDATTLIISNGFYVGWHHVLSLHVASPSFSNSQQDRPFQNLFVQRKSLTARRILKVTRWSRAEAVPFLISTSPLDPGIVINNNRACASTWHSTSPSTIQHGVFADIAAKTADLSGAQAFSPFKYTAS